MAEASAVSEAKKAIKQADALKQAVKDSGHQAPKGRGSKIKYKKDGTPRKWYKKKLARAKAKKTSGDSAMVEVSLWGDTAHAVKLGDSAMVSIAKMAGGVGQTGQGSMANTEDRRQQYRQVLQDPQGFITETPGDLVDHCSDTWDTANVAIDQAAAGNYRQAGRAAGAAILANLGPAYTGTKKVKPKITNKFSGFIMKTPIGSLLRVFMKPKQAEEIAPSKNL